MVRSDFLYAVKPRSGAPEHDALFVQRNALHCANHLGRITRFRVKGSVNRESLDESVQQSRGLGVKMVLQGCATAGHPCSGDVSVGGSTGSKRVQLMGEYQVMKVAKDIVEDDRDHRFAR